MESEQKIKVDMDLFWRGLEIYKSNYNKMVYFVDKFNRQNYTSIDAKEAIAELRKRLDGES